jgi:hypothetical protein
MYFLADPSFLFLSLENPSFLDELYTLMVKTTVLVTCFVLVFAYLTSRYRYKLACRQRNDMENGKIILKVGLILKMLIYIKNIFF